MNKHFVWRFGVGFALACLTGFNAWADGLLDGRIGEPYGSTRAIDSGNDVAGDGECANTAGRGNLMDFFAMSVPGVTATNDPWYFSFTVDSSQPLNDTAGSFFGMPASTKVNYMIGIEVACDGAPRLEMWQNGLPWEREFAWNVDFFIAMFANGPDTMEAQLWSNDGGNNRSMIVGGITVTSRVVGLRRQLEFILPSTAPVPEALRNNSSLCLYLLSVQEIEGAGAVLDGVGLLNHNINCQGAAFDLSSLGSVFVNTEANGKTGGRPTDPGANTRQSLSNPNRSTFASVTGQDCAPPFGIAIDGVLDSDYVLLTEAAFAAPYQGGSSTASDFVGESAARTYTYIAAGVTNNTVLAGGRHADLANVYAFGDTNHLYLMVTGPTSLGWENEPDQFNVFVAIDMPGRNSGNDSGTSSDLAPGAATAPAGRMVNFKGWDPDYVVELVWRGVTQGVDSPANLFAATGPGAWNLAGTFLYQNIADTAVAGPGLYYSRSFPQYEFAIPWTSLGLSGPPAATNTIRLGVYSTGDENLESANQSGWDIADQAPGIGQGCGGEGCHERVGDDAGDDDHLASSGDGDRTPFVGRTYGNPAFVPATDNSRNDVDTIEEYFAIRLAVSTCLPAIDIEKSTNGQDADTPTGPLVSTGSVVTWTYTVRNTGAIALTNVIVHDDHLGFITNFTGGDANANRLLDTNETWTFTRTGTATAGQYMNMGSVTGRSIIAATNVADLDPSHYFGSAPGIRIEKATNGQDADTPTGPVVGIGSLVTWSYVVTNTGNVALTNVVVTDDRIGVISGPVSGDANGNQLLDPGEVWTYTTNGLATAGQYVNTGVVTALSIIGEPVSDDDPSHYFGSTGAIDIEKATNGQDADSPTGPVLSVGSPVTWTYVVRNTGNVSITNVSVSDTDLGPVTNLVSGDLNGNRILETNETWTFSATGSAVSGQYSNDSTVAGVTIGTSSPVSDSDPSHYFGSAPGVTLAKTRIDPAEGPAFPGESVVFQINVVNTGNVALAVVPVVDQYETAYLTFVSAVPASDDTINDGVIEWTNVGPLAIGASTSITVTFTAAAPAPGDRTNRASVAVITPDGHPPVPPLTNTAPYTIEAFAAIGDFVWHDVNGNGIQDGGETGVANTVVTLYDGTSNAVGIVTTGINGAYAFTNLAAGTYTVGFLPPAGYVFTWPDQGANDAVDSDAAPSTGRTAPIVVSEGAIITTIDAGVYLPASLGDYVWHDADMGGVQEGSETGVPGVVVTLLDAATNVVGVTTSGVNGAYAFTNLAPGVYSVLFIAPPGSFFTSLDETVDALDSDAAPGTGLTTTYTLLSGEHNPDIDAGLNFLASVGNFVWWDLNADGVQDQGEPGIEGVRLTLFDINDVVVGVATSDPDGYYVFTNLFPGTYHIRVEIEPGFNLSPYLQGGDPALDSNPNPNTARTDNFSLSSGEYNETIDVGFKEYLVLAQVTGMEGLNIGGRAVLRWETASEYATAGWYVERCVDGERWERVSEYLPASGNVALGSVYEWIDDGAATGARYRYRLVEVETLDSVRWTEPYDIAFPGQPDKRRATAPVFHMEEKIAPAPLVSPSRVSRQLESAPVATGTVIGAKVAVTHPGLYRVSANDLASVLDISTAAISNTSLRVEYLGVEARSFRIGGDVVFVGEGYESRYTSTNIYRIVPGASAAPSVEPVAPSGSAPVTTVAVSQRVEQQRILRPDLFSDAASDPWLWYQLVSGIKNEFTTNFSLPKLSEGTGGSITIRLKGASQSSGNGFHGARVLVNGTILGETNFFGLQAHAFTLPVPGGLWVAGSNQLKVVSVPPPGVTYDIFYVDGFDMHYTRRLDAVSNMVIAAIGAGPVEFSGFTSPSITVWDVSNPWSPVRLSGVDIVATSGLWSARWISPRTGEVMGVASESAPAAIGPWVANDLKETHHEVDYLVIHATGLSAGALALAADRQGKGLSTKVVSVEQVYDAFNHGIADGRALKAFIPYACRQWARGPRYVVLVGDGTIDFRNFSGAGDSPLPGVVESTQYGSFTSDNSLGDINGDGFIDVAIGRIPVVDTAQLSNYIAKLTLFENGGAWRERALISTDDRDVGGIYIQDGDYLAGKLTGLLVNRADIETLGATDAANALKSGMENGHELTLYIGHGNMYQLAEESILNVSSAASISNQSTPGVVGVLSCLIGSFTFPGSPSLGKTLMTRPNGAAALFASSSLITLEECREMTSALLEGVYDSTDVRLGDAWIAAKNKMIATNSFRVAKNYQLFGDPALAMGAATAPRGGGQPPAYVPGYDEWQAWAFGPAWNDFGAGTGPSDNPDGDDLTNEQERQAGTDPTDADSVLVVVTVRPVSGGVQLSWPSVPGRVYRIERTIDSGASYQTIADDLVADPSPNSYLDTSPASAAALYRVYAR